MKLIRTLMLMLAVALITVTLPAQTAGGAAKTADKSKSGDKSKTAATADVVDINTATVDQLKALPGIGDKYSAKIVAGRPYAMKTQLVSRGIIPQATYNKIADKIKAKQ
jgi:DNA uptake protein ComE-like DNA-binding protein